MLSTEELKERVNTYCYQESISRLPALKNKYKKLASIAQEELDARAKNEDK